MAKLSAPIVIVVAGTSLLGCKDNQRTSNPPDIMPARTTASASAPAKRNEISANPPAVVQLKAGEDAPKVKFKLQNGKEVDLASLKGKQVLVYFYPKDETPGCTMEAQKIRDSWKEFQKAGIQVFGVSKQDEASHKKFIEKEKLPYDLVVDSSGEVGKAFHVPAGGEFFARQSFLIGKDGKLKKAWYHVNPSTHADEVLAAAKLP
jgi:thioredoxin-dependent peroxiredoxin